MYVVLFGGSGVWFSAIFMNSLKFSCAIELFPCWCLLKMVLELWVFFLKGVLHDKKLLICSIENVIAQLTEKENLFKPNRKSHEVK